MIIPMRGIMRRYRRKLSHQVLWSERPGINSWNSIPSTLHSCSPAQERELMRKRSRYRYQGKQTVEDIWHPNIACKILRKFICNKFRVYQWETKRIWQHNHCNRARLAFLGRCRCEVCLQALHFDNRACWSARKYWASVAVKTDHRQKQTSVELTTLVKVYAKSACGMVPSLFFLDKHHPQWHPPEPRCTQDLTMYI